MFSYLIGQSGVARVTEEKNFFFKVLDGIEIEDRPALFHVKHFGKQPKAGIVPRETIRA
jgi:hypothetical protein